MGMMQIVVCVLFAGLVAPVGLHLLGGAAGRMRWARAACLHSHVETTSPEATLAEADHHISAAPLEAAGYTARGAALLRLGRYDDACRDFSRARALDRVSCDAVIGLAHAEAGRGRRDAALAYLAEAVRLDPRAAAEAVAGPALDVLRGDPLVQTIIAGAEASPRAA